LGLFQQFSKHSEAVLLKYCTSKIFSLLVWGHLPEP